MKHEEKIALLKTICDEDNLPICDQIYRIGTDAGQPYIFATDRHRLLAFEADSVIDAIVPSIDGVVARGQLLPSSLDGIKKWLEHREGMHTASFLELLKWCDAVAFEICPCCNGSGTRPVDYYRRYIADDNFAHADFRRADDTFKRDGAILGVPLDLRMLLKTIAYLPAQELIQIAPVSNLTKTGAPMLFVGDGWRYVQMSLNPELVKDAEEFGGIVAIAQ
jgi:hypothetical protein